MISYLKRACASPFDTCHILSTKQLLRCKLKTLIYILIIVIKMKRKEVEWHYFTLQSFLYLAEINYTYFLLRKNYLWRPYLWKISSQWIKMTNWLVVSACLLNLTVTLVANLMVLHYVSFAWKSITFCLWCKFVGITRRKKNNKYMEE